MLRRHEFWPSLLIFSGVVIGSWLIILPMVEAQAFLNQEGPDLLSPSVLGMGEALSRSFDLPSLPFSSLLEEGKSNPDFLLTIERLGIQKARIIPNVDGQNRRVYLKELLSGIGHLKGSSFPGEGRNIFLFGHSSLPFLFNSRDYSTIFSTLDKLKRGDLILVEFAGKKFFYRVENIKVVSASSSASDFDSSREKLTLFTCFPPGLLTERLAVTALPTSF